MSLPPVVRALLVLNCVVYLLDLLLQSAADFYMCSVFGLFYVGSPYFHIWQPLTYMFMHGSLMHLFFNMFALWIFGRVMEQVWGAKKFLVYYIVCGLGAALTNEVVQALGLVGPMHNTVGASGAIYGVLLAFGVTFPNERLFIIPIPVPIKAKYLVSFYVLLELYEGFNAGDNVAHFAHLGGMLVGLLLILYWRRRMQGFHLGGGSFWNAGVRGGSGGRSANGWGHFGDWLGRKKKGSYNRNERGNFTTTSSDNYNSDYAYNRRKREDNEEIDRILEKIRQRGYEGLTAEEKKRLFDASKN